MKRKNRTDQGIKVKIEAWQHDYNTYRPHSSLGNMTPLDFSKSVVEDAVHEAGILTA
jgi:transposase InsO family protein